MGVDAVKMLFPWNVSNEKRAAMCRRMGEVVTTCDAWDIPLVLEPVIIGAPRSPKILEEEVCVARIAYELGAHIIKIAFPGEERTSRLAEELGVPLAIAGGPRSGEIEDTIEEVRQPIVAGARGRIVGRNVWQRPMADAHDTLGWLARLSRQDRELQPA